MAADVRPGRFRKKPVVIEAMQFVDVKSGLAIIDWMEGRAETSHAGIHIDTLEGTMLAQPDDWVIKGVQGEFYPCKPDIFEQTYEVADDAE